MNAWPGSILREKQTTPTQRTILECMSFGKEYTAGDIVTLAKNRFSIAISPGAAIRALVDLRNLGEVTSDLIPRSNKTVAWKRVENKDA